MNCPNCYREISDGFKFCPYCATPIVANKCPHCGCRDLPTDSKYCPDCGNKIKNTDSSKDLVIDVKGVLFKMIYVEGGTFIMGATPEMENPYPDEKSHQVTLSSYSIGETPVTQELWQAVMGNNPSFNKGDKHPVERVSWNDCQEFIKKINQMTGKKFRLPTEAEWEFAARGGNRSNHTQYSGSNRLDDVAWYHTNSEYKTHPVKTKNHNELGIYDMSGNVSEWCQDRYGIYSDCHQTNPTGSDRGSYRVVRGRDYRDSLYRSHLSSRVSYEPYEMDNGLGFRLAHSE